MWSAGDITVDRDGNARGFTLFELLVVLSIVGLISAVALPRFIQALPGTELKNAARDLGASLRKARSEAIRSGRQVTLVLTEDTGSVIQGPGVTGWTLPRGLTLQSDRSPPSNGPAQIRFYPDGSSEGGGITLARGTRRFDIGVDWLTGAVKVRER